MQVPVFEFLAWEEVRARSMSGQLVITIWYNILTVLAKSYPEALHEAIERTLDPILRTRLLQIYRDLQAAHLLSPEERRLDAAA
jgi:hypothetical protein